jgi:hypothetical protein
MKDMLWMEDIVESPLAPPFLTNSKVDMVNFVNARKVVARSAFLPFYSVWNGVDLEGEVQNERLKCQSSQVEKNWIYNKSLNWFPY